MVVLNLSGVDCGRPLEVDLGAINGISCLSTQPGVHRVVGAFSGVAGIFFAFNVWVVQMVFPLNAVINITLA
jgi:hypothetical protein